MTEQEYQLCLARAMWRVEFDKPSSDPKDSFQDAKEQMMRRAKRLIGHVESQGITFEYVAD